MEHIDEELVLDFLGGNLSRQLMTSLEAHLGACADCLDLVAFAAEQSHHEDPLGSGGAPVSERERRRRGRVGRFELLGVLGRGGMGVVYRARARDTGQAVALKKVKLVESGVFDALQREIHALGRLEHPGVIRVIEQGIADGLPWYAMDFVEGETLQSRLRSFHRRARGERARFQEFAPLLRTVRALCETLAFVHGEGVVHRDLKPSNIIIRADERPVLIDFGLATGLAGVAREAIEPGATGAGTPAYMAPEQLRNELVDARADLYALGSILYEVFVGAPPDRALDEAELPPPSRWVDDLPLELEAAIVRLLTRRPAERLAYAQDVARVLDRVGGETREVWGPAPRSYVYRPSLVGRARIVADLCALIQERNAGTGGLALIAGESGIGKTRLALEVASFGRRTGRRVVRCDCAAVAVSGTGDTAAAGVPLQSLRPLLRAIADYCYERGEVETDRIVGERGKTLAVTEPWLASLAGQEKYDEPSPPNEEAARYTLLTALEETLARFSEAGPVLLVLDDLQWADDLSLSFIQLLGHAFLKQHALVVIGTYRSEELPLRVSTQLLDFADQHHELSRLDASDIDRMVADMLALDVAPRDLLRFLSEASEGQPFFVTEYVRTAVDQGWLTRNDAGKWQLSRTGDESLLLARGFPLPETLKALLERRLASVSPRAHQLALFASVLGRAFDPQLLEAVSERGPEHLESLHELSSWRILEEVGPQLRFVHDKMRETTYAQVAESRAAELHRVAALAIEDQLRLADESDKRDRAAELAYHWALAGDVEREAPYRRVAGDHAFGVGAYQDAVTHLKRVLDLSAAASVPAPGALVERQLAEAYFGIGDMRASRDHLEALVAQLDLPMPKSAPGMFASIARDLLAAIWAGGTGSRERTGPTGDAMTQATRAYDRLAHVLFFENQPLAVACSSFRALGAAQKVGPSPELSRVYANLSISAALIPAHALARALSRAAQRIAEQIDDAPARTWARELDGVYRAGIGDFAGARASFEAALASWQQIGDRRRWEESLTLLGMTLFQAEATEDAWRARCQLEDAARASGSLQALGWAWIGQAEHHLVGGGAETAMANLERALSLGTWVRRVEQTWLRGLMALALLRVGQLDRACRAADESLALMTDTLPTAFYVLEGYSAVAEVYLAVARAAGQSRDGRILRARAARAIGMMQHFARVFPIARPRALLWQGAGFALGGDTQRAQRCWQKALPLAHALGRKHDERLLLQRLTQKTEQARAVSARPSSLRSSLRTPV